jgi:S-adenosylmethionine-diacylglycerol 3-amino-3-carboxypropyl transferase
MTTSTSPALGADRSILDAAVHRSRAISLEGLLERAFTFAFRDLVYAQIWEDPIVDIEALDIYSNTRIVAIASGGCNLLSYLTADPARVHGVDLNAAHVALNQLKLTALTALPDYDAFYRFVGRANDPGNVAVFDQILAPQLAPASLRYWNRRDSLARRRITVFERNIYRTGLLGRFIGLAHFMARRYGVDPQTLCTVTSRAEMQSRFDRDIAPIFDKRLIKLLLDHPMSLYGLGIPPAQYTELVSNAPRMADVVCARLRRLLCDFDLNDNYFAWQALKRGYKPDGDGPLPPYLQRQHFESIRTRAGRVDVQQISITAFLAQQSTQSLDRYVLLDAQDWMTSAQVQSLWQEITRTARPGARVIFRTAAVPSMLPAKLDSRLLRQWTYQEQQSEALFKRDRSAIYGGFHLYTRAP